MNTLAIDIGSYSIKFFEVIKERKSLRLVHFTEVIIDEVREQMGEDCTLEEIQEEVLESYLEEKDAVHEGGFDGKIVNDVRNKQANKSLSYIKERLVYKDKMLEMSDLIDTLILNQKVMGDSDKLNEIIGWIKNNKSITKQNIMNNLNWGRGIKWTPYRRALMNHPNIFDVNDSEPTYIWKE